MPEIPLGILGLNRSIKEVSRNDLVICLVLPEGIAEECGILFTFSLLGTRACSKARFTWRLHPIVTLDKLVRRMPMLGNLPSNMEISTRTFEEDIARRSRALYRDSTAVVTAAANGVMPIYLEQSGELSIDPLFEISGRHPSVGNVEQFVLALGLANQDAEADEYCRKFYGPLDSGALAPLWT